MIIYLVFCSALIVNVFRVFYVRGEVYINETESMWGACDKIIENAVLSISNRMGKVICNQGYDLVGPQEINCSRSLWNRFTECVPRCLAPPNVANGFFILNDTADSRGYYHTNTLVTYTCDEGYALSPREGKFRLCEKGFWIGPQFKCVKTCVHPSQVFNGYFSYERDDLLYPFAVGQKINYSCNSGYSLEGTSEQLCLETGEWSPQTQPVCWKSQIDESEGLCGKSPYVPHSTTFVVEGRKFEELALPGTVIEIKCRSIFRKIQSPVLDTCQSFRLRCSRGRWIGTTPVCVPSMECPPPPFVAHATVSIISGYKMTVGLPIKSQVSYQCPPNYVIEGNDILTCSEGGCWLPAGPPSCLRVGANYYMEVNNNLNSFLVSMATGAGVLTCLLVICLLVIFKRKRQLTSALTIPPPVQRQDMGDHAILLHQPDRLALIAFAEGMQGQRNILPTYDEATRDRAHLASSVRLQRLHWQHISCRRNRNSPNPDLMHIGRHGSFISHTPSTRSAGDSMGSTDTMAISENSTNVTLDTASSHSGSQAPSCTAHCGSLASFDTGSAIITDDVPLLEESELEDVQVCDAISLVLENPSLSDNASYKLSTATADLP